MSKREARGGDKGGSVGWKESLQNTMPWSCREESILRRKKSSNVSTTCSREVKKGENRKVQDLEKWRSLVILNAGREMTADEVGE